MVRHYNKRMHVNFAAVFEETVIEYQGPSVWWQKNVFARAETYIIRGTIFFDVRQVSAIEDHDFKENLWSAAAPGCGETPFCTQARAPALQTYF